MPASPRSLPPATLSEIVPPSSRHHYFHRFEEHPFDPRAGEFSVANAWWLAELAMLAYGEEAFIREVLQERGVAPALGLELTLIDGSTRGARALVFETADFVILVFRGTRIRLANDPFLALSVPVVDPSDFLTDIDLRLDPDEHVHTGFKRSLDEVWDRICSHLDRARSVRQPRPLWLTGHSLGAALATLAAARLSPTHAGGLVTLGSPRVGDGRFSARVTMPAWRVVNNTDIVTQLPPPTALADYRHVGKLEFLDSRGVVVEEPPTLDVIESNLRGHAEALNQALSALNGQTIWEAGRAAVAALNAHLPKQVGPSIGALGLDLVPVAGIADHMPIYYALKLWNALRHVARDSASA